MRRFISSVTPPQFPPSRPSTSFAEAAWPGDVAGGQSITTVTGNTVGALGLPVSGAQPAQGSERSQQLLSRSAQGRAFPYQSLRSASKLCGDGKTGSRFEGTHVGDARTNSVTGAIPGAAAAGEGMTAGAERATGKHQP